MEIIETTQKEKNSTKEKQNLLTYRAQSINNEDISFISDSWYKNIIQTTLDGFWLSDMDGNIIEVNDSMCKMLGYSSSELKSMNISDVDMERLNLPEEIRKLNSRYPRAEPVALYSSSFA